MFALFLLAFAGIPLTSGFIGKWAVFAAAWSGGAWALVVVAVLASVIAAFFYVRVIVLMFFSDPVGDGPAVAVPSVLTTAVIGVGAPLPSYSVSCPDRCSTSREQAGDRSSADARRRFTPVDRALARSRCGDPALEGRVARAADRASSSGWARRSHSEAPFVTEASRHLINAGGKRFRPMLVLVAAEFGDPGAPRASSRPRSASS